ncbi:hypothetical protein CP904_26060 [Enterobacter cloacae]|nr:hypothetical protein CP904_26060 [Enterobacter cloacae]
MVTGSSQRICLAKHAVALEVCAKVRLHWKDRFGCCALRTPSYQWLLPVAFCVLFRVGLK